MQIVISLVAGLLFGAGLTVSRMVNPEKILSFLDLGSIPAGGWDPTLAFVMTGALIVSAPAFWLARRRGRPFVAERLQLPTRRDIDGPLVAGALLFGIGWGLVGYCPGPAISGLALGRWETALFVAAMLAGMAAYRLSREQPAGRRQQQRVTG